MHLYGQGTPSSVQGYIRYIIVFIMQSAGELATARSKAITASISIAQRFYFSEVHIFDLDDNELRDSVVLMDQD